MTVPSPPPFVAGDTAAAAEINAVLNFLLDPPSAKAYAGGDTNHNSSGTANWITVALNSETYDNDSIHSNVTANSKLTVVTAGVYDVAGALSFDANATGTRAARLLLNGTDQIAQTRVGASPNLGTNVPVWALEVSLDVGEYVQLQGAQNSGGNLDMKAGEDLTWLAIRWRRPQ